MIKITFPPGIYSKRRRLRNKARKRLFKLHGIPIWDKWSKKNSGRYKVSLHGTVRYSFKGETENLSAITIGETE